MSEPVKIAIVVEGGALTAVLSAGVPVDYILIDYDVEGSDAATDVPQHGGGTAAAHVTPPEQADTNFGAWVLDAHTGFKGGR